jgi:hypothetical protein
MVCGKCLFSLLVNSSVSPQELLPFSRQGISFHRKLELCQSFSWSFAANPVLRLCFDFTEPGFALPRKWSMVCVCACVRACVSVLVKGRGFDLCMSVNGG